MTRYRPLKTFWEAYAELDAHIKEKVRQKFKLFQQSAENPPFHSSLRIHEMRGHPNIWEGHITMQIVFTFHIERDPESGETIYVFRNVGTHDIYRKP